MSDQRDSNLYDVLNADEARSEEESVMGSDTADFYVADSLDEVPLSTSMPSDQGQDSILVPPDTSVSVRCVNGFSESWERTHGIGGTLAMESCHVQVFSSHVSQKLFIEREGHVRERVDAYQERIHIT